MGEHINVIMIVGFMIIIAGIIYGLISNHKLRKSGEKRLSVHIKSKVIMLFITLFLGGGIVQYGDYVRKKTFTKQEINFINENKKFSSFSEEDLSIYRKTNFTYEISKTKVYDKYYNQFLEWGIDSYLEENKHSEITREKAKIFVEKDMKTKREFYLKNYCKGLCKLAML